jgi:glutaryl-CoA dehydrogenase
MQKFDGLDYFNSESLFSEEEIMIRNSVRDFVSEEIIPIIEHHYREGKFPFESCCQNG